MYICSINNLKPLRKMEFLTTLAVTIILFGSVALIIKSIVTVIKFFKG